MNPLQIRLAALRRHLWLVVGLRGACWLVSVVLFAVVLAGWLDWRWHLPSFVRALLLTGALAGAGYVALRFLLSPLVARADDLTLALRVESHFPAFNDSLGSAIQFLTAAPDTRSAESPSLRRQALATALSLADKHDFSQVVDSRGTRTAGVSMTAISLLAVGLALADPLLARTALIRLTHPFGAHDWPRQTQLEITARSRIGRGEPFEIHGVLRGIVPESATVFYRWSDASVLEQTCDVLRAEGVQAGTLFARLDAGHVQRTFRFQVRANDAVSDWRAVAVLPPVQLVPLDGRPSPQVRLHYPAYTDLSTQDLPDGISTLEAVAGTEVTLRAATDRPVARAWLEYPAELIPALHTAACLSCLGAAQAPAVGLELALARQMIWMRIPARLDRAGHVLEIAFHARAGGLYTLHMEDETGIGSRRLFEVRVHTDPAPLVHLERPSRSHDGLDVLPGAEITLRVLAEDQQYAIRSVYLAYQQRRGEGAGAVLKTGRASLYDALAVDGAALELLAVLARSPIPALGLTPRLRPQRLEIERRWSLQGLQLKAGDLLSFHVAAEDFDDVTVGKPPGRSHEIELRVVSPAALEIALNEAQARVQQELLRLQKQQQEALDKVSKALAHARSQQGKLKPNHLDDLLQAEQLQQQVRARIGTREEGLRAEVERILRTLRDNGLPRSGAQDRMEIVSAELERLARDPLPQIEPRLTSARKENELATEKSSRPRESADLLREAQQHQQEVTNTLSDLLKLLEPWSSTQEIKGEARLLLQEQRQLGEQTGTVGKEKDIAPGRNRASLTQEQKAALDQLVDIQNKLAERTLQLLDKMDRVSRERRDKDPETSATLRQAAEVGKSENAANQMKAASRNIQANQLARAGSEQDKSVDTLQKMVEALEERREAQLDRLRKKLREAEQQMADLSRRQEELQKKAQEASQLADPQKREQELKRLAREQEQLQQEAQEMVRQLTRLRAERSAQALSQASGRMRQAGQQLEQAEEAADQQDEALDRLADAQDELEEARAEIEEELMREKLAKLADQIKGLKERQETLRTEAARIHRTVLQAKDWNRPLLSSLSSLRRAQENLAQETTTLTSEKLTGARVFVHLLQKAADYMEAAGESLQERFERARERGDPGLDEAAEHTADEAIQKHQRLALERFDQVLEALKPEAGMAAQRGPQQPGAGQPGAAQRPAPGSDIPPLAQLKALRGLQHSLNERTAAFSKRHPDTDKLAEPEKAELQTLQHEQQEITELFQDVTAPADSEENKP